MNDKEEKAYKYKNDNDNRGVAEVFPWRNAWKMQKKKMNDEVFGV